VGTTRIFAGIKSQVPEKKHLPPRHQGTKGQKRQGKTLAGNSLIFNPNLRARRVVVVKKSFS
jgi:hypothetical protein